MLRNSRFDSLIRQSVIGVVAAVALSACGSESTVSTTDTAASTAGQYEVAGDHAIGNPNAPVTVVEYASVVCGACANWHNTVFQDFKEKYVDPGHVRFIFREFPTAPENLARAGFLIANCADEDKFMENISLQFKRQRAILSSSDIRGEYVKLAKASGLSEAEFQACLANVEENERLDAVEEAAFDAGVTSTPTFFINGEKVSRVEGGKQLFTLETFETVLDPMLGIEMEEKKSDEAPEAEQE